MVQEGLKDKHPYVREVSVIGVLKCYQQDMERTVANGLIEEVKTILQKDTDTQVLANCLYTLQQLGALGDTILTHGLMVSFLNNIRSFSEWGQCLLLEILLKHYRPRSESERFDALELLDFGLNHTNSAVVLAAAKFFLQYTSNYKEEYEKVIVLIKGPLQTLINGREPEIVYAVLQNVQVLAMRHPEQFAALAADFFYRPEDPSYLKILKLDLFVLLTNSNNGFDLAEEACQYARDRNDDVARHAVRTMGRIATKAEQVDGILDRLLIFLSHRRNSIIGEAVVAFADALSSFPDAAAICVPSILQVDCHDLQVPDARAAFLWILGQFGEMDQESPYVLESLADSFEKERYNVKIEMLTASLKLFCKRPPECLPGFRKILSTALKDSHYFISERASMYSKLLENFGKDVAHRIVEPKLAYSQVHESVVSEELRDKLFDEWNTLSVVYGAPSVTFIEENQDSLTRFESDSIGGDIVEDHADESLIEAANRDLLSLSDSYQQNDTGVGSSGMEVVDDLLGRETILPSAISAAKPTDNQETDFMELLGSFDTEDRGGLATSSQQGQEEQSSQAEISLVNTSQLHLSHDEFKQRWDNLEIYSSRFTYTFESPDINSSIASNDFSTFVNHFAQANLKSLGKPIAGSLSPYRFYFYGSRASNSEYVLLQAIIQDNTATVDVRSEDLDLSNQINDIAQTLLMTF